VTDLFSPERLELIARECGLIQRKWRSNGAFELTLATIASVLNGSALTSTSIRAHLFGMFCNSISKVSILEHFKKKEFGVFLNELLTHPVYSLEPLKLKGWLSPFSSVNLYDSSSWKIPEYEALIERFPATGGDGGNTGIKVSTRFDVLDYTFPEVLVFPAKKSDTMKMFELNIAPKSLQLFDLGFFSVDALKKIDSRDAYYISRCQYGRILEKDGKRLTIEDLDTLGGKPSDLFITMTAQKIPVRLTAEKLPNEAYQKRVSYIKRQAQRQGRHVKEEQLLFAQYNTFLTNINDTILPPEAISVIYSYRWQLELAYKVSKSLLRLVHDSWKHEELLENSVYAVFLTFQTIMTWAEKHRRFNPDCDFELSPWMVIKHFSWLFLMWLYSQINPQIYVSDFLNELIKRSLQFCQKDNRESRPTTLAKIEKEISYNMLMNMKNS